MRKFKYVLAAGVCFGLVIGAAPASAEGVNLDDLIGLDYTPQGEDIIVTHKTDPAPEQTVVRGQIRKIANTGNAYNEPIARFQSKLCPGVMGLPRDVAEMIVGRVRYNAERLDLKLSDDEKCKPNLLIGFVGSGQSDVKTLGKKNGGLLSLLPLDERRALVNDPGPVHAWSVTATRSRDGVDIHGDQKYGKVPTVNIQSGNSLFLLATRIDIDLSVVLIDISAIDGLTVNQLADYATIRGLVQTKPVNGGETSYGTILSLFDENAAPQPGLSKFDLAYLTSVYSNEPNIMAAAKFGAVADLMEKQEKLAGEQADAVEKP